MSVTVLVLSAVTPGSARGVGNPHVVPWIETSRRLEKSMERMRLFLRWMSFGGRGVGARSKFLRTTWNVGPKKAKDRHLAFALDEE